MKTNEKTIVEIVKENRLVVAYARHLEKLVNARVVIGGSYALACQLREFSDRDITDYDFIIYPYDESQKIKIIRQLETLVSLRLIHKGYYGEHSYKFAYLDWGIADVLISDKYAKDGNMPVGNYETPERILEVKKAWVKKFEEKEAIPRKKDLEDIKKIEEKLSNPFFF